MELGSRIVHDRNQQRAVVKCIVVIDWTASMRDPMHLFLSAKTGSSVGKGI